MDTELTPQDQETEHTMNTDIDAVMRTEDWTSGTGRCPARAYQARL